MRTHLAVLAVSLSSLVGCGSTQKVQEVNALSVALEGCPARATATLTAGMGSCDQLLSPTIQRSGASLSILLEVYRSPGACTMELVSQERSVPLGALEPGEYTLSVEGELSGKSTTFVVPACSK